MRAMISRRDFARTAGAIAGAALLPRARADEKPKTPGAPPPKPSKLLPAAQAEADARVQMIVARYGARLSPAERADLVRLSNDVQPMLDKLRAFPLDYGDEPAHIFRAPRRRR
jgi:hypothetical protein